MHKPEIKRLHKRAASWAEIADFASREIDAAERRIARLVRARDVARQKMKERESIPAGLIRQRED